MNNSSRKLAVSVRLLALAVGAGVASLALTGCVQDPTPFDPRDAQTWERSTDDQVKARKLRPLPTTAETPYLNNSATMPATPEYGREAMYETEQPEVPMTLQEIIHRTVVNNLDIRVASYDTAIDQTRVLEAEANFDPSVFADASVERIDKDTPGVDSAIPTGSGSNSPATAFTSLITRLDQETISTVDLGLRENLPTGGKIELKQTWTNNYFFPARGLLNPYYQNDLTMQLTQPLLQNYGIAVNRARITIAVNNQRISLLDFRKTLEDTILKVEQTYWQLVESENDLQTVKNLIQASEETTNILKRRGPVDVGAVPMQDAISQTESRKVTLIQLQGHIADLSDQLKQLMNDPRYPISSSGRITPLDQGLDQPMHFNLDDQIETAMENRLELGQQQVRVDSSEVAVDVARNNLLPQLNAQITGGVDGLSRTFGPSMESEGQFNRLGYSLGFEFVFPLGNRAANAVWQRSLLQRLQAIVSYGALVKTVTLDVKTAARAVDYAWFRLREAKRAALSAKDLVDKEREQRKSGDSPITPDSVFVELQHQQQLAAAEQAEHQASNDYNYAIANLEKAKGTILRYNHVMLEQDLMPAGLNLTGDTAAAVYGPGVEGLHH